MGKNQSITVKDAVHKLQLYLLDGIRNEKQLFAAGSLMSCSDYEDVVAERTIANFCGYPLCNSSLPLDPPHKGRYRISLKEHKVYDLQETNSFCSSSCLINSKSFAGTLPDERCSVLNPVRLNEIFRLFEKLSLDDSIEVLEKNVEFGMSRLNIQENVETKGGEVTLEEWMGPSNAIDGYIPQNERKHKASCSKNYKKGSNANVAKPSSSKDLFYEMDFKSTIITSDEYSISKVPLDSKKIESSNKLEESERNKSYADLHEQLAVLGSSSALKKKVNNRNSVEAKQKGKLVAKDECTIQEHLLSTDQNGYDTSTAQAEKEPLAEKAGGPPYAMPKSSLKSSGAKKLHRSVTWADEKPGGTRSENLCEIKEIEDTEVGNETFCGINKGEGDSSLRFASAEACALALSKAAEAVSSGDSEVSDAVSEAGIIILPHLDDDAEEEDMEDSDLPYVKWPVKAAGSQSDLFDPEESWFDAPPADFSLSLSTFSTMWNALFGWITSSSLAYIYGKDESSHEEYLSVNGMEYPRKRVLGDGRSTEIKETFSGFLARCLPALYADLRLPIPISDLEKGMGCMLDTMSFIDPLPAFRTKQWQVIILLFIDALSVCRMPSISSYMTNGRILFHKVLNGGSQISVEEYEIMKDLLIPLGRAPQFSAQSGA